MEDRIKKLEDDVAVLMADKDRVQRVLDGVEVNNAMTAEMYGVFQIGKNAFKLLDKVYRFLAVIGRTVMALIELLARIAKPIVWVLAAIAAGWGLLTTGKVPDWVTKWLIE